MSIRRGAFLACVARAAQVFDARAGGDATPPYMVGALGNVVQTQRNDRRSPEPAKVGNPICNAAAGADDARRRHHGRRRSRRATAAAARSARQLQPLRGGDGAPRPDGSASWRGGAVDDAAARTDNRTTATATTHS